MKPSSDGEIFLPYDDTPDRSGNGWGIAGQRPWEKLLQMDDGNWFG